MREIQTVTATHELVGTYHQKPRRRRIGEKMSPYFSLLAPRFSKRTTRFERHFNIKAEPSSIHRLVKVGDSICFPDGIKSSDGPFQPGSFGQVFADTMGKKGIQVVCKNYADLGHTEQDVMRTLQRSDVQEAITSPGSTIVAVSLSGNGMRHFIDNASVQADLETLQSLSLLQIPFHPRLIMRLANRFAKTTYRLGDSFLQVCETIDRLDQKRLRLGNGHISGLILTQPPNFGLSPEKITFVPLSGQKDVSMKQFDAATNAWVRRIAKSVAHAVKKEIHFAARGFVRRRKPYPVALFPLHKIVNKKRFFSSGDQHINWEAQKGIGENLARVVFKRSY